MNFRDWTIKAGFYGPASRGCGYVKKQCDNIEKFVIQVKRSSNQTIKGYSLDGINRTCHGGIYADSVTNVIFDSLDIRNFKFAGMWINYSVDCAVKNSLFKDNTFSNQANDCGELLFYSNRRRHCGAVLEAP